MLGVDVVLLVRGVVLCVQVRGVRDSPGCLSRAVFIWRTPNLIDDKSVPYPSEGLENCMQEAMDSIVHPKVTEMNEVDKKELVQICRDIKFNHVRLDFTLVLLTSLSGKYYVFVILFFVMFRKGLSS